MKIKIPTISFVFLTVWILSEPYITTLAVLIAAFLHETGHILTTRIFEINIMSVTIYPLGADIQIRDNVSYGKNILIALSGPLANILTILLCEISLRLLPEQHIFIANHIASSSLSLAVINLLPIKGFDGGSILSGVTALLFSEDTALFLQNTTSFITIIFLWLISMYILLTVSSGISLFALCAFMFSTIYIAK